MQWDAFGQLLDGEVDAEVVGIESKPQACTIRAPLRTASSWYFTYMRSTNVGSPVRST